MSKPQSQGKIRVGTCKFKKAGRIDPSFENYTPIVVLTKSSEYGDIGPYCLKNSKGQIMENIWQFSKVYQKVPNVSIPYNRFDKNSTWEYDEEIHMDQDKKLNKKYWKWRKTGMNFNYPVRYPVGHKVRHECIGAIFNEENPSKNDSPFEYNDVFLNYIESRKKIYAPVYIDLVKKENRFKSLQERLKKGENLLIIEVDGPKEESLDYYKKTYKVGDDFIVLDTIEVNEKNMKIMLNDSKHAFGHGYCLGIALLGKEEWFE
jgi:hypothetical protein